MQKRELLYEGKAKKIYTTDDSDCLIAEFKDDLTAFNALKKSSEQGKGALNCEISAKLFEYLNSQGVKTHFIKMIDSTHQLIKRVDIIPLEVVVRNIAAGSITKRLGLKEGEVLDFSIVEFYYKDDELDDPIVCDDHCILLKLVDDRDKLRKLRQRALQVNRILGEFFDQKGINLVDFKLEFGINKDQEIVLSDEISPDSCRLWDKSSGEKLDKDLFREDLGSIKIAYEEVLKRVLGD